MKRKMIVWPIYLGILFSTQASFGQKTVSGPCTLHPNPLIAAPVKVDFLPNNLNKTQVVTIQNPTNAPVQVGQLVLDGANADKFALQSKNIIKVKKGASQPKEDCSNSTIQPHGSCSFRVAVLSQQHANLFATIHVFSAGCDIQIPLREFNSFVQ